MSKKCQKLMQNSHGNVKNYRIQSKKFNKNNNQKSRKNFEKWVLSTIFFCPIVSDRFSSLILYTIKKFFLKLTRHLQSLGIVEFFLTCLDMLEKNCSVEIFSIFLKKKIPWKQQFQQKALFILEKM